MSGWSDLYLQSCARFARRAPWDWSDARTAMLARTYGPDPVATALGYPVDVVRALAGGAS